MKKLMIYLLAGFLFACEKEISVELPPAEPRLVVEGIIEQGFPPVVTLTESRGFFEEVDSSSLMDVVVSDAEVWISDGTNDYKLSYFQQGVLGAYSNFSLTGSVGKTYYLKILWNNKEYTASTSILQPVAIDSLWFEVESEGDSLGFIWARLQEPAGEGDCYRWFAQRLGKDDYPIPPIGSVFDDKFIEGKLFDVPFYRGVRPNSQAKDDNNRERGYFKEGDTVLVRFCKIDQQVFDFIYTYELETAGSGNPFAAPTTVKTNITGGALGYFGGYGAVYDTVICKY